MIEALLIGLVFLRVVGFNFGKVSEKYFFPVCVFKLRGVGYAILDLPGLEFRCLGTLGLTENQGKGTDEYD